MRKIVIVLFTAVLIYSCGSNNKTLNTESVIKAELEKIISEIEIPGINLAIQMPDNTMIEVSAGYSDREKQILMKP